MKSSPWFPLVVLLVVGAGSVWAGVPPPEFLRQFRAQDARAGDDFGRAVALDGKLGIIGAPKQDVWGEDSGAAYLFDVLSGQQLHKLIPVKCG